MCYDLILVHIYDILCKTRRCTTVRISDDQAIPLRLVHQFAFYQQQQRQQHQQHQRISSISASAASAASLDQQHQRISIINNISIIKSISSIRYLPVYVYIHQVRSYQHMSINTIRHYGPDTTRYHHTCIMYGLYGLKHHIVEISGDVTDADALMLLIQ